MYYYTSQFQFIYLRNIMNEKHIENFLYQKTNWNLSREVEYKPEE